VWSFRNNVCFRRVGAGIAALAGKCRRCWDRSCGRCQMIWRYGRLAPGLPGLGPCLPLSRRTWPPPGPPRALGPAPRNRRAVLADEGTLSRTAGSNSPMPGSCLLVAARRGGTVLPASTRSCGIATSSPDALRTVKEASSAAVRTPRTSAISSPSPAGRRHRVTTRLPTSAALSRISKR
jgi:hypothetical protein